MNHFDLEKRLKKFVEELKNSPYAQLSIPPIGPYLYGSQMRHGWYEEEYRELFPELFQDYNE